MTVYVNGVNQSDSESSVVDAKGDLILGSAADSLGRLAVGSNGMVPTANSGDALGVGYAYPTVGGIGSEYRALTNVVAATCDPMVTVGAETLTDGRLVLCAVYVPYDVTLTGVGWIQHVQGDTTADNNNKVALFTSDGTNLTIVASSADSGTLWESAAGNRTAAFTSTYAAQAGLYWIGILANWSAAATAPQIVRQATILQSAAYITKVRDSDETLNGFVNSQADMPATTLAWSGVSNGGGRPFLYVY